MRCHLLWVSVLFISVVSSASVRAQSKVVDSDAAVRAALKKAVGFYRGKAASHGGYVYHYSEDLRRRWGEGEVSAETIVVQPPGTPTVGQAFLKAFEATDDPFYRDAAREAAKALVRGQLQSGGWTQVIHFGPAKTLGKYRKRPGGSWNASSLDDGQTQSALQLLAKVDFVLGFKDAEIHEAALFGLNALLDAQFPNGAFPQVWTGPVARQPVVPARYPDYDWKTEGRVKNYWDHYTLNDGLAGTVAETLITAHRVYKDDHYRAALARLGDFLVLSQMPEPQPGWCQQYGFTMVPIWARKFEPPAITGWESQDVMETLIKISQYMREPKYLEPIPRALAYFRKCLLPDGRVARYYELKTNKPLFMDAEYRLTYDASAAPSHYGWIQPSRFDRIARAYEDAKAGTEPPSRTKRPSQADVQKIIEQLDDQGRWVSTYQGETLVGQPRFPASFRYIASEVFCRNVTMLCDWLDRGDRAAGSKP